MKSFTQTFIACVLLLQLTACNYVTYTPRSKKNVRRERPSILLMDRIVDFRIEQHYWPYSKEDFMSKGKKYYEVFQGFPYNYTHFKTIDSNTMVFTFSDHIKDRDNYNETQKVDLNSYSGSVRFYREKDKFIWKLKLN